jgi:quinol monooxygenase YgiN
MTLVITDNRVKDREAYLPLAKAFAKDGAHDKGCHGMTVYMDPEISDRVVFVSKWDSKDDFLAHVQGSSFAKHIPGMGPYYISGTDTFLELV